MCEEQMSTRDTFHHKPMGCDDHPTGELRHYMYSVMLIGADEIWHCLRVLLRRHSGKGVHQLRLHWVPTVVSKHVIRERLCGQSE